MEEDDARPLIKENSLDESPEEGTILLNGKTTQYGRLTTPVQPSIPLGYVERAGGHHVVQLGQQQYLGTADQRGCDLKLHDFDDGER